MIRIATAGETRGLSRAIVGRVSSIPVGPDKRAETILVTDCLELLSDAIEYVATITTLDLSKTSTEFRGVHKTREIDHLADGYIIVIEPNIGFIRTIFRPDSKHNLLFVTERCSSNCLMCSQPPKDQDDVDDLLERNLQLVPFIPKKTEYLTISGGEPGLLGERLFRLLAVLRDQLPNTHIHILSNGRVFAWNDFAASLAEVNHPKLSLGIPLYSDTAEDHDYVVQARGAFDQTLMGIQNLARYGISIELRVVLHQKTVSRLTKLAEFIYRNLPFVDHIALMGLEYVGYAPRNHAELWIDPFDYQNILLETVKSLRLARMNVSIYNHQLCVLPAILWKYAKQSISDWKNIYIPECEQCAVVDRCGGLFKWSQKVHSAHIKPFANVDSVPVERSATYLQG